MAKRKDAKRLVSDIPTIEFTNFGPIAKAKFTIKPLTIFVGPNNSGKTYAAMLTHSLLSSYANLAPMELNMDWLTPYLTKKPFKILITALGKLAASATDSPVEIPAKYSEQVHNLLYKKIFVDRFSHTLTNNFNAPLSNLIRAGTPSSKIKFSHNVTIPITVSKSKISASTLTIPPTRYTITNIAGEIFVGEKGRHDLNAEFRKNASLAVKSFINTLSPSTPPQYLGLQTLVYLMDRISSSSIQRRFGSFYLPAARSGMVNFKDTIVSSMINNVKYGGSAALNANKIPATFNDFLQFLINVQKIKNNSSGLNGKSMIEDMFGGKIVLSNNTSNLPTLKYKFANLVIPLNRSSSAITELAPLQLLQDYSKFHGVLIIEEPEAHLHPRNQLTLAKHIVRMVQNGTFVILTTHSEFFLEQLSNFLQMSTLTPSDRKKLGYDENDFLHKDSVALYTFHKASNNSYITKKLSHSVDYGIPQDEFNEIIEYMHEEDYNIHNPDEL